ncbi:menaquinone biosynthetic enzyme MqnA/MqnD family protein [Desertivirga xinjiangensis]|uniref:menaquinone biosynthetic enzyme MqnA/MqnD family protein n=1 Tax=Desertivirga xinjiangensis TaxID=539206 RepID=UPI00210EABC5|nr:menaquinone biosynthesis protein [Pedobacter xinjiangensis]
MSKIKISAVSYTNTKPFLYGLQHSGILNEVDLTLDVPSDCADKLINNQTDIGLVPVAALLKISNYHIVSDYCIGAVGAVDSVFIFSERPIHEVRTLRLDTQSRTSNALARVLLKNYWKTSPKLIEGTADAFVEIGDRTFGKKNTYPFVYDLAQEWMNFTGLPFTFAVWAANKPVDENFIAEFNKALKYGLNHRREVIKTLEKRDDFDLDDYLNHKIDYPLTRYKREALALFLKYVENLK